MRERGRRAAQRFFSQLCSTSSGESGHLQGGGAESNSDCRVAESNSDCRVAESNSDCRVVESNSDCRVVESNSDCRVVESNSDAHLLLFIFVTFCGVPSVKLSVQWIQGKHTVHQRSASRECIHPGMPSRECVLTECARKECSESASTE